MPYLVVSEASELQDITNIVRIVSAIFVSGTCGLNGVALNIISKASEK